MQKSLMCDNKSTVGPQKVPSFSHQKKIQKKNMWEIKFHSFFPMHVLDAQLCLTRVCRNQGTDVPGTHFH